MTDNQYWVEIGSGQEARVLKGNLSEIEGIGGIIELEKPVIIAKRVNWNKPIYNYEGHDLFCKHLVARLLEELFLKEGKYSKEHIPTPLGSFNNGYEAGYYYKYVKGSEGFPFELSGDEKDDYRQISVEIEEWTNFKGPFNDFGFSVENDISDAVYGKIGKNIIMSEYSMGELYEEYEKNRTYTLHSLWKRIDFGSTSCPFDYDKFVQEMTQRKSELEVKMGKNYNLAFLAARYYNVHEDITQGLERLILQFRRNY